MTKALISLLFMKCIFTSFGSISVPTVNLYKISFVNDSNSVSLMSSNEKDFWLINSKINRIIYLLSLLFVGFANLLYYKYSFINNVSILALITALLLVVVFFMQFLISF